MHVNDMTQLLDRPEQSASWLKSAGLQNLERAATNLQAIARSGMTLDQVASLAEQLKSELAVASDPDRALNNLEKFVLAARSRLAIGSLFQRDATSLTILLKLFSASQYLSDLLIRDRESYDYLRLTEGQLYSRDFLVATLRNRVLLTADSLHAMQILRRFKHHETLRIAFGDLIVGHRIEQVTQQISFVADAIIDAALSFARDSLSRKWGTPMSEDGSACRFVIFALGKLGGLELNYSSDIDLIAVYEADGPVSPANKSSQQYFERVTRETIKLLNETTSMGAAFRVDMRLRPEGRTGPICCNRRSFLRYYDLLGRTWERQALIKARPVAGDLDFGNELLSSLMPWIYRPILNRFDIAGIRALKRQIEHRAVVSGQDKTNIKTGYGGIRDIEFTIQFLQLLNGGAITTVRTPNTLDAIRLLAEANCLNLQEADLLRQNYCWLRQLEHRLQIMFDLQTHTLPDDPHEVARTAKRMGYKQDSGLAVLVQFQADLQEITGVNNQILNHLLHNAFKDDPGVLANAAPEINAVDLILQPDLSPESIAKVLGEFGFQDPAGASQLLKSLASESAMFLSSRRCRHFLAAIIQPLLQEISQTPNPDFTLVSLSQVADAIGGKAALWELFSFNQPSLELFIRLCASSDYLCAIIRHHPGMIDELIDSLLMIELPTIEWLRMNLDDLLTGAEDPQPIFNSFKNVHHLRVGIRDLAGRDPIQETHRALSDIAEVCVERLAHVEFGKLAGKFARPDTPPEQIRNGNSFVILALGKLGGREPNYHSDLDVVFLYDSSDERNAWLETSSQHFYSRLAAAISKVISHSSPSGKLYELDSRLRPTGKSGALAVSFNEFQRYFASGQGQLWERLALCKARPVFGTPDLCLTVMQLVQEAITAEPWQTAMAAEIHEMRLRMQDNSKPQNLKRGIGGTADIEFIVEMLQLKHAKQHPIILVPGTLAAIGSLMECGAVDQESGNYLMESYQFLRGIEARLRLIDATARHDFPEGNELQKIAYLLKFDPEVLAQSVTDFRVANRKLFDQIFNVPVATGTTKRF